MSANEPYAQEILARNLGSEFAHSSNGPMPKSASVLDSFEKAGNRKYGPPVPLNANQTVEEMIKKGFVGIYIKRDPAL